MQIQFFNEINPILKPFIRHYWYVNSEIKESSSQLLLPMDHVDLIMTIGKPFVYSDKLQPDNIHFHGFRETPIEVTQSDKIQALGISFTPWGFYFFARQAMNSYTNKIVALKDVAPSLSKELYAHLAQFDDPSTFIPLIESSLIKKIYSDDKNISDCKIIEAFINCNPVNINGYCKTKDISIRKLERIFNKYIGISPKRFMNVIRFEESTRDIIYDPETSLTDISYKNGYYDQPHFVKVFKEYTNYAPREFKTDKPALKSHFDYD